MGAAYYVVLDSEKPGLDYMVDGKALAAAADDLDEAAAELGVKPLTGFFSITREEAFELVGIEGEDVDQEPTEVTWFTAEEGLRTVRALLSHCRASDCPERLSEDLTRLEQVLAQAAKRKLRWHLSIDIWPWTAAGAQRQLHLPPGATL